MKIQASANDFARWIGNFLKFDVGQEDSSFIFTSKSKSKTVLSLEVSELESVLKQLKGKEECDYTAIYDEHVYEVMVKHTSALPLQSRGLSTSLNGITYTLTSPSSEYALFLLYRLSAIMPIEHLSASNPNRRLGNDVLEILRKASPSFLSLRLESERSLPADVFVNYATAFLYELGYNLDAAFIAPKHFDDLLQHARFRRQDRRASPQEVLPPRRFYNPNLTHYYQLALSSKEPSLQYLSYYHILEYFGEGLFVANMIRRVKDVITQPGFSYARDDDIKQVINTVEKPPKIAPSSTNDAKRDERALRMTLEHHIDVGYLSEELKNYDADLVRYYRDGEVPFLNKTPCIDFEQQNKSSIYGHLARRIYRIRNAIVHSKEGETSRYIPFRDDIYLIKEIPLLRFTAELIIVSDSEVIS